MRPLLLALALLLWPAFAAAAQPRGALPNAFVERHGPAGEVDVIDVRVKDGVLPPHQDKAALAYVAGRMPATARAEWLAFVAGRNLTDSTAAERMAEFLITQNLRTRLEPAEPGGRPVRLSVLVDEGHAQSMMRTLLVPGLPSRVFPRMAASFRIEDAATGALLASGRIRKSLSEGGDIKQARERLGLNYNPLGSDLHFQSLAGMTNAMAENLTLLLRSPVFPSGRRDLTRVWVANSLHTIRMDLPEWDVVLAESP